MYSAFDVTPNFRRQGKMSFRFLNTISTVAIAAMLSLSSQASFAQVSFPWSSSPQGSPPVQAQSDDADADMRIQRLENQLRQLTGQNEELQYRNRQLEERLRQLGGGAAVAPAGQPPSSTADSPYTHNHTSADQHRSAINGKALQSRLPKGPVPWLL